MNGTTVNDDKDDDMKRRIIVRDRSGERIGSMEHDTIDASNVAYNNAGWGVYAIVQEECNLGHWHDTQSVVLAPWGDN